jgi:hypothetical protein
MVAVKAVTMERRKEPSNTEAPLPRIIANS